MWNAPPIEGVSAGPIKFISSGFTAMTDMSSQHAAENCIRQSVCIPGKLAMISGMVDDDRIRTAEHSLCSTMTRGQSPARWRK
jgi:hypothetical protein